MFRLKRYSLVVASVVGLAAVALAAWQWASPSRAEAPRLEQYLPAGTVGFIQVHDLRAQALRIAGSEVWRELGRENATASSLFLIGANHMGVLDASYAIALTGVTQAGGAPEPKFVLVGEFTSRSARRTFERRVLQLADRSRRARPDPTTERYGSAELNVFTANGKPRFAYARVGNTMIVGNTAEAVKEVLDVREGRAPALAASPQLAPARAPLTYNDGMFGFLDGAALTRLIDSLPASGQREAALFRQLFHDSGADSAQAVALTSSFVDGRVVERFRVVTPGGGHGPLRTVLSSPPATQSLLGLVPDDARQVFDASIASAPQAFEELAALLGQAAAQLGQPTPDDLLQEVLTRTGVDLRNDIVQALGSEICLADLSTAERRQGVLILNLSDQGRLAEALGKLAQRKGLAVTARDYRGVELKSAVGKAGRGLHYAFLDGNFVASGEPAAVERVIDTAQSGKSLAASDQYRAAAAALSGSPLFIYYGSNKHYLGQLSRLLSRHGKDFVLSTQESDLRPSFAFGVGSPDGLYVESHSPLGTFPRLFTLVASRLAAEQGEGTD